MAQVLNVPERDIFFNPSINKKMGNLLYVIAVVLVVIWAIGFFGYAAGGIIHVLLVIALVLFLLKFIRREA
jgi:predicted ferric reductase